MSWRQRYAMKFTRKSLLLAVVVVTMCLGYACLRLYASEGVFSQVLGSVTFFRRQYLPVLSCAANGRWIQGPITQQQRNAKYDLFRFALEWQQVPNSLQREDGLCGNVTYVQRGPNMWIRALCNPTGPTPCCYQFHCQARSEQDCVCPECRDLRQDIVAEYSTWQLEEANCRLVNWTREEACSLLNGSSLVLVGDSIIRHIHTALLLLLTANPWDGALNKDVTKEVHDNCVGERMFTEKLCRIHLNRSAQLCNSQVSVHYHAFYHTSLSQSFHDLIQKLLGRKDVYVIVGIGFHDNCNADNVFSRYMQPALELVKSRGQGYPRIIWVSPHAPGLFKTPDAGRLKQDVLGMSIFTAALREKFRPYGVPVLEALNMTRGVASFDGSHTGMAVNLLKNHVLLTHIMETKTQQKFQKQRL